MFKESGDTVLLVEDEATEILLAQQAVESSPGAIRLVVVPDSVQALQWVTDALAKGESLPRLILLNLKLPHLIGLAVLRTLRMDERLTNVPIVVFSAFHEHADVLLSYQIGANSFVEMPKNQEEFSALLSELSGLGWLGETTRPAPSRTIRA